MSGVAAAGMFAVAGIWLGGLADGLLIGIGICVASESPITCPGGVSVPRQLWNALSASASVPAPGDDRRDLSGSVARIVMLPYHHQQPPRRIQATLRVGIASDVPRHLGRPVGLVRLGLAVVL